jgi:hypothetical protein
MALWAGTLVSLFVLNRRYDLAYLPEWLGNLGRSLLARSPIGVEGLAQSAGGLILASLIVLAWWGLGSLVLDRLVPSEALGSRALDGGARALVGSALWSTIWFVLGCAGLYRPEIALVATAAGLALAARAWRFARPAGRPHEPHAPGIVGLIAFTLGLALVAALAPPTANDALMYHLSLPKAFIASRGLVEVPYNMATYFPLGVEMHAVWAMLLGQVAGARLAEAAAGATLAAFGPLLALATYGWARARGLDRRWSAVAALMVASIPSVYFVIASEGVDVAVAGYATLALVAAGRWWPTLDRRWLGLLAAAVGAALSAKLSAVALVIPLIVAMLARAVALEREPPRRGRPSAGTALASGLGALAVGVLLASPWYIRTWIWAGTPLFPLYSSLWPGHVAGWDRGRAELLDGLLQVYGRSASVADYLLSPFTVSILAQPELPRHYEGVLGPAFLVGAPLLIWAFRRRRLDVDLRLGALIAAAMFVLWLLGSQVIRYLLPAMPALAVAVAAAAASWGAGGGRLVRGLLVGAAAANVLVVTAWFVELDPVRVVLGGETRTQFLERRLDSFEYYQIINHDLPPDARVWLIDTQRDTYHLERPYFADYLFGTYTLAQWVREAGDAEQVRARARALGITHLFVRHDRLLDYARSAVVDDAQARERNLGRLAVLRAFLLGGTRLLKDGRKFWLIQLGP